MTNERREKLEEVLIRRQENITVVFENVEDPHNIAAVLRTCESVGMQDVYILNHTIAPHPKFGEALGFRSSSSAWKWLSLHYYDDLRQCVDALRNEDFRLMATGLSAKAIDLYEVDFTQKLALIFGNERKGVTQQMLSLCDGNFLIPQVGIIQSLNISVACAISLYEAYRQKKIAGHYQKPSLSADKLSQLKKDWGLV